MDNQTWLIGQKMDNWTVIGKLNMDNWIEYALLSTKWIILHEVGNWIIGHERKIGDQIYNFTRNRYYYMDNLTGNR